MDDGVIKLKGFGLIQENGVPRSFDDLSCGGGVIKLNGFGLIWENGDEIGLPYLRSLIHSNHSLQRWNTM